MRGRQSTNCDSEVGAANLRQFWSGSLPIAILKARQRVAQNLLRSLHTLISQSLLPHPFYLPGGIGRVSDVIKADDFVVSVNGHDHALSVVEAVFLSPRVAAVLKSDPTIRRLDIADGRIDDGHIADLLALIRGSPVKIAPTSRVSLILLSRHLGNTDLAQLFFGIADPEVELRPLAQRPGFDLTVCSRQDLFLLDVDTLDNILANDAVRIRSEDWLLELALELGDDYRRLLRHVRYEFVSKAILSKFLAGRDHSALTDAIWGSLVPALFLTPSWCSSISDFTWSASMLIPEPGVCRRYWSGYAHAELSLSAGRTTFPGKISTVSSS
jgi:hypothetical protein